MTPKKNNPLDKPLDRAVVNGYQAGVSGKSKKLCPFKTSKNRDAWITGWQQGKEDLLGGYKVHVHQKK